MGLILRYLIIAFVVYLGILKLKKFLKLNHSAEPTVKPGDLDPYFILEVPKKASQEEIKAAYKKQLAKYHPDKVDHLGDELKDLAQRKTKEISWAYDKLST